MLDSVFKEYCFLNSKGKTKEQTAQLFHCEPPVMSHFCMPSPASVGSDRPGMADTERQLARPLSPVGKRPTQIVPPEITTQMTHLGSNMFMCFRCSCLGSPSVFMFTLCCFYIDIMLNAWRPYVHPLYSFMLTLHVHSTVAFVQPYKYLTRTLS